MAFLFTTLLAGAYAHNSCIRHLSSLSHLIHRRRFHTPIPARCSQNETCSRISVRYSFIPPERFCRTLGNDSDDSPRRNNILRCDGILHPCCSDTYYRRAISPSMLERTFSRLNIEEEIHCLFLLFLKRQCTRQRLTFWVVDFYQVHHILGHIYLRYFLRLFRRRFFRRELEARLPPQFAATQRAGTKEIVAPFRSKTDGVV